MSDLPADLLADYAHPDGPWLRANMIASADGAATYEGLSGGLGNETDKLLFQALRPMADAIIVGANTVRIERYGKAPVPMAVVSRSLDLDFASPLFDGRPILITVSDAPRLAEAREHAEVIVAGEGAVDFGAAVAGLHRLGLTKLLCEGGPTVLGGIAAAGLLDELCLTLSPRLVGGAAPRIVRGPALEEGMSLAAVRQDGDHLFLRYRRSS
ncbi:dihydrofolate reductase family protein [Actinocorallia sp. A-T 12471]|uniref:dihydrofolate reductase family protein n=1 Tax=Actinocorallia sp. A-T 12471 TaxID=3089813 RepID=UPI0029CCFED7|nr:dihydrofolate reductase family protein [Actinocorallia sp. A-T 12471]MDX6741308.1 dihydrofolate reductase family protein [Actinocorallia sp. A-T 12471]